MIGILPTENENASSDATVIDAIELLKKQRKIYEDEEKALRVLREEETEVFNRLENEKQKKRKQSSNLILNITAEIFFIIRILVDFMVLITVIIGKDNLPAQF